jgi:hypothetical protein
MPVKNWSLLWANWKWLMKQGWFTDRSYRASP